MTEKKSWGSTVLGWFIVQDDAPAASGGASQSADADAALIAAGAAQSSPAIFQQPPPPPTDGQVAFDEVFGAAGIRHGAGMRRGTIAFLGGESPPILPSFRFACRYRPEVMLLLLRHVRSCGFPLPDGTLAAGYDLFNGDLIEGGRGELLVRR